MKHTHLAMTALAALLALACAANAAVGTSPTMQFPTSGWQGYAPARIQCGTLKAADFNVTTDQAIPISAPSQYYMLDSIAINNASVSLTTAAGGFYSAASKGGTALVANSQAYTTLTAAAADAAGSAMLATIATAGSTNQLDLGTIYFSLTTPQGAAATADIRLFCRPLM